MKKTLLVISLFLMSFILTDCGHNIAQWGAGSSFRLGSGEFSLSYTDGLFLNSVNRENTIITAEIDSTVGASYDPVTGTFKGIKSISVETGPQLTGYSVDMATQSPEAMASYYDALKAYYQSRGKVSAQPLISDEKSKAATLSVSEVIKAAIAKAKDVVDDYIDSDEGRKEENQFVCDGNCDYSDLTKNPDIAYQLSIAMKLLQYDGDQRTFPSTGERYKTTLEHFISEVIYYQSRGHKNTPLRVKYVTVENKTIVKLMYAYVKRDGTSTDVECPSCCFLDDKDAD